MAIALKNIKDALYPGLLGSLYPGWKITQDFTSDTIWVEGPDGYVSNIPRVELERNGAGLEGVLEFILHKDARMKREAALQVPLYEQMRVQAQKQAAARRDAEVEATIMGTKGAGVPVDPKVMQTAVAYQRYLGLSRLVAKEPDEETQKLRAQQREVLTQLEQPVHQPWNGVREVDLD